MKIFKIILIVIAAIVLLAVALFGVYLLSHRQGVIKTSEFVNSEARKTVLIASQGSRFKNELVDSVVARLKRKLLAIKVVDVTTLQDEDEADFCAFVIIHTTEKWVLQPDVKRFLDRSRDLKKILLVTTSGQGEWRTKDYDVDVITSASRKPELKALPGRICAWIEKTADRK